MKQMEGVAVGLVKEVDAKLGRIKVSFPWMDPPRVSHWAPIASLLSGKKRGARFMPETDDEALVVFDRGHFDHPYIVGFLWNGVDEGPDDEKTNRLVVTPGGHELRFEDKENDRRVVLKTDGKHTLTMDDKAKSITLESTKGHKLEILDNDGKITLTTKSGDSGGGRITLEDQPGTVTIEASQNTIKLDTSGITIDAKAGKLEVTSNTDTTITANANVKIEAKADVSVKSTASMTVESTATMDVKSTGKMTVHSDGMLEVTATGMTTVKSTAMMNVEASGILTIKSSGLVTVTASMLSVSAAMASFSGVVQCSTLVATTVVGSTYTPGAGNLV